LTERRWYLGTLIIMTLQMTDSTHADGENAIAVLAKVIRSGPDGVGFKFVFTMPADARNVKTFDGSRLADKKALSRFLRGLR